MWQLLSKLFTNVHFHIVLLVLMAFKQDTLQPVESIWIWFFSSWFLALIFSSQILEARLTKLLVWPGIVTTRDTGLYHCKQLSFYPHVASPSLNCPNFISKALYYISNSLMNNLDIHLKVGQEDLAMFLHSFCLME